MQKTFLWYDYETFGINFRYDLPSQFAAVRTDEELNILDETLFYLKPAKDYVPNFEAILITGITPQIALQKGLCEAEFAKKINQLMRQANTCILGYNTIRFDDHITRHLFYRNFFDPYEQEYANGNSRWDLLDVTRTAHALRPKGVNWPLKDDGLISFKLEDLTKANEIEEGANAHDALADTRATIKLAKLIKQSQPQLFEYLFNMRGKKNVASQIEIGKPILHISGRYPRENACVAIGVPVTPVVNNSCLIFNLSQDPKYILDLNQDEIKRRIFTTKAELEAQNLERVELKSIWINRSPIVLPVNSLTPEIAEQIGISIKECERNFKKLQPFINNELSNKLMQATQSEFEQDTDDAAMSLYSGGFFDNSDKKLIKQVSQTPLEDLANNNFTFRDERLNQLFFVYKAKNIPEILTSEEMDIWEKMRYKRLMDEKLPFNLQKAQAQIETLSASQDFKHHSLLEEYRLYLESLIPYDV